MTFIHQKIQIGCYSRTLLLLFDAVKIFKIVSCGHIVFHDNAVLETNLVAIVPAVSI